MRTQTLFTCPECGKRIEYDFELKCYLEHRHTADFTTLKEEIK